MRVWQHFMSNVHIYLQIIKYNVRLSVSFYLRHYLLEGKLDLISLDQIPSRVYGEAQCVTLFF